MGACLQNEYPGSWAKGELGWWCAHLARTLTTGVLQGPFSELVTSLSVVVVRAGALPSAPSGADLAKRVVGRPERPQENSAWECLLSMMGVVRGL